jgi:hypothetical protein
MKNFKNYLLEKDADTNYNFRGVLDIIREKNISVKSNKLSFGLGLATIFGIYIDIDKLESDYRLTDEIRMYIILHEIGHYVRMKKLGEDNILDKMSRPDFEHFFQGIIEEEIFADRWASIMYYKLNRVTYPRYMTQELHLKSNQEKYRDKCKNLFGQVDNDIEKYKLFIQNYIN